MFSFVSNILYSLFNFVLRFVKKAVCCFKRRRRLSCEPVALTNIGVVSINENETNLQTWKSWEDSLTIVTAKPVDPIQQQIELYREQKIAAAAKLDKEEAKTDYFQDMAPKIIKQTKLLLPSEESTQFEKANHFSLTPDPIFNSSELELWEESQSWEDQTQEDWNANDLIREKKRMDREKKIAEQQKKRIEKDSRIGKTLPATRIC